MNSELLPIGMPPVYCVPLIILCLSGHEIVPTGQRLLLKGNLGARMMIMWEDQLVDPPIAYITTANVM